MSPTQSEWLNLLFRWLHVVAAIYWVGQTYLFAWLDGRFAAAEQAGKADGVWLVHSGGFYRADKLTHPDPLPAPLYWTWWESVLTWISGIVLLLLVYYSGGLLLPAGSSTSFAAAAAIGIGSLVAGWVIYDLLWISPLGRRERLAATISFLLLAAFSWILMGALAGRAAFMHVGAMLGTIMAVNVWARILPAQRQMVAAITAGAAPDPLLAGSAKQRSRHNGFLAIPVVLIMISNHFPTTTYGHPQAWLVLGAFVLAGWGARWLIKSIER